MTASDETDEKFLEDLMGEDEMGLVFRADIHLEYILTDIMELTVTTPVPGTPYLTLKIK